MKVVNLPAVNDAFVKNAIRRFDKEADPPYSYHYMSMLKDVRIILEYARESYQLWLNEELSGD